MWHNEFVVWMCVIGIIGIGIFVIFNSHDDEGGDSNDSHE